MGPERQSLYPPQEEIPVSPSATKIILAPFLNARNKAKSFHKAAFGAGRKRHNLNTFILRYASPSVVRSWDQLPGLPQAFAFSESHFSAICFST
jgi:hypothetical protein